MPTPTEQAREMFPNVPEEVFKLFLADFINETTWKFSSIFDSTAGTPWYQWLGELSLYEFSQLRWNISTLFINKNNLHPYSYGDIKCLIMDHVIDADTTARTHIPNSKERFIWHMEHIQRTGKLFAPAVMIRTQNNLRIIDGNHRIAAFFTLGLSATAPIDVWIGA